MKSSFSAKKSYELKFRLYFATVLLRRCERSCPEGNRENVKESFGVYHDG